MVYGCETFHAGKSVDVGGARERLMWPEARLDAESKHACGGRTRNSVCKAIPGPRRMARTSHMEFRSACQTSCSGRSDIFSTPAGRPAYERHAAAGPLDSVSYVKSWRPLPTIAREDVALRTAGRSAAPPHRALELARRRQEHRIIATAATRSCHGLLGGEPALDDRRLLAACRGGDTPPPCTSCCTTAIHIAHEERNDPCDARQSALSAEDWDAVEKGSMARSGVPRPP
jgi:hypothetical protein